MVLQCLLHGCMLELREGGTCRSLSPDREGIMGASSRESKESWAGATVTDCVKLATTIRQELMSDMQISIELPSYVEPSFRPSITISTQGWDEETGKPVVRVWATRVLGNESVGFTYNALYECLIVAYRGMDEFLRGQLPLPAF
jgi:hypothetical protein